ncbi:MAG: D-beta-hydroxybutyrate dehydrogenase [Alphaproteobacteria bacterium MarineAlpha5_Bin5]|nr:MAG: D-beta-hydroxybutyrate dehydrogenase [Alphaproteobacteria bacterium MarineAlpha5_Bin5]|tara:strand:- start:6120 stop:6893 length:774 start_codon:yes stop_codon:yes gene_type:complete
MNKTILITGGLGGIGLDLVKFFYNKKFNVILLDNKNKKEYLKLKIKNKNYINFLIYKKIDLSKNFLIKNYFSTLKKNYKNIDILINCVGIQHIDPVDFFSDFKWEQIIKINLSSFFYTSKYILPLMKKNNWGRIINIASVHGKVASINKSAYVASKHGIIGLTKTIALETATLPITCNAICPGWVNTPLVQKQIISKAKKNNTNVKLETKKLLKEKHPNLKFISGKAIASLAYYLCSEDASEITGSSINIDGGWTSQ